MPYEKNLYGSPLTVVQKQTGIAYSKNPSYLVLKAPLSVCPIPKDEKLTIYFKLINHFNDFTYTRILDSTFFLFGKRYESKDIPSKKTHYLKSYNHGAVKQSIYTMLKDNLILEDFDIAWGGNAFSSEYDALTQTTVYFMDFILIQKSKGRPIFDVSLGESYFENRVDIDTTGYFYQVESTDNTISIGKLSKQIGLYKTILANDNYVTYSEITYSMPKSSSAYDAKNYEMGVDIFKSSGTFLGGLKYEKLTTLSKKRIETCDFNLREIIDSEITDYKPSFSTIMQHKVLKNLERFGCKYYQKYIDNQDINKVYDDSVNYVTTIYNDFESPVDHAFYAIQASEPLFETAPVTGVAMPDLLYKNEGTYGSYNDKISDINLTKQPKTKIFGKQYEILCNLGANIFSTLNSDKIALKFNYKNNSSETISISTSAVNSSIQYYINYFILDRGHLLDATTSGFALKDVNSLDVNFYTNNFNGQKFEYETQTYLFEETDECTNINEEEYTTLVFKNSYGAFDVFDFKDIREIKTDKNTSIIVSNYDYRAKRDDQFNYIYDQSYSKSYTTNSKILTKEEYFWLEDLIKSDRVYILEKGTNSLMPIIITKTNYNFKADSDLVIEIEFTYSRREII